MRFIVTFVGNRSAAGELFFSIPAQSEISKAAHTVANICRDRAKQLAIKESLLEKELVWMEKGETAFHVLLLKELADWSKRQGFPIMLHSGEIFGSLIAFLLGITSVNPLKFMQYRLYPAQSLVLNAYSDFEVSIAKPIQPLMNSYLTEKFGRAAVSEYSMQYMIHILGYPLCEKIGLLRNLTGQYPRNSNFDTAVCIRALHNYARELADAPHPKNIERRENNLRFANEWKDITECDFYTLTRIFAYCNGKFHKQKSLENLRDPDFFVTREELFSQLKTAGMSENDAAHFSNSAVSRVGYGYKEINEILDKYSISQGLREKMKQTNSLWSFASAASRVQLMCTLAWYEVYFPDALASI